MQHSSYKDLHLYGAEYIICTIVSSIKHYYYY